MTIPAWVRPGLWGVVIGALGWWAALAWGFGWVSAGTAKMTADHQVRAAVISDVTPYCVSRFEQQANAVTSWQALQKAANNYNQDDFLTKGGWVELPGQKLDEDTASAVADSCATRLLALKQLDGVTLSSLK